MDAAGLKPARTWDEFKSNAQKLHKGDVAGCSFIGANDPSLGLVDWFTRFITIGGKLMSGDPNGKDFKPNIASPEGIAALQMLIDVLPYAPKNVTQYGFAENVDGFSAGKIAQMIFWSTIAGSVFDKDKSIVADKTSAAVVPAAPGQKQRSILGGWGIGIPKNADDAKKAAAWRALTWLTSKKANKYEVEKYQVSANRALNVRRSGAGAEIPLSARFGASDRRRGGHDYGLHPGGVRAERGALRRVQQGADRRPRCKDGLRRGAAAMGGDSPQRRPSAVTTRLVRGRCASHEHRSAGDTSHGQHGRDRSPKGRGMVAPLPVPDLPDCVRHLPAALQSPIVVHRPHSC